MSTMAPTTQPLDRLLRLFDTLPDQRMHATVLVEHLRQSLLFDAVDTLNEMLLRASMGDRRARIGAVAVARWLTLDRDSKDNRLLIEVLRSCARTRGAVFVERVLTESPAQQKMSALGRQKEVAFGERAYFQNHISVRYVCRFTARGEDESRGLHILRWRFGGDVFLDLLKHKSPVLIGRLLDDKGLDLRQAVWIAGRRPTSAVIVREILQRPRWFNEIKIREAVVANPFVPASIAAPLVATLSRAALKELVKTSNVHPDTVETARCFLSAAA